MTDREEIRGVATANGWQVLRPDGNADSYHKAMYDVDVFHDQQGKATAAQVRRDKRGIAIATGHQTKATAVRWLQSPPPVRV